MNEIYTPTVPFADIKQEIAFRALDKIKTMTEDQVRYALWCTLTLLFGDPSSNATEVVDRCEFSLESPLAIREAHLILTQIGIGRVIPLSADRRKAELEVFKKGLHAKH